MFTYVCLPTACLRQAECQIYTHFLLIIFAADYLRFLSLHLKAVKVILTHKIC